MMSPQSLIVMLLIMIIIPTILYTFFFLIRYRRNPFGLLRRGRSPPGEDSGPRESKKSRGQTNNDDDNDNNKHTEMVVLGGSKLGNDTDCPVCLSVFKEGEQLKLLKVCKHMFHQSCIDTWLSSHFNCPVCRAFISHHHAQRSKERENQRARVLARDGARDDLWQGLPDAAGLV